MKKPNTLDDQSGEEGWLRRSKSKPNQAALIGCLLAMAARLRHTYYRPVFKRNPSVREVWVLLALKKKDDAKETTRWSRAAEGTNFPKRLELLLEEATSIFVTASQKRAIELFARWLSVRFGMPEPPTGQFIVS